jgi:hypothetical protein
LKFHKSLNFLFVIILLGIISLSTSCTQSKNIVTYLAKDETVIYFIRPSDLSGDKAEAEIDFTLKLKKKKYSDVICNFTIKVKNIPFNDITSTEFKTNGKTYPISKLVLIFREKGENKIRYSGEMKHEDFIKLFEAEDISFVITTEETSKTPKTTYTLKPCGNFKNRVKAARIEFIN